MNIESPAFKTAEAIYAAVNHSKGMRHAGHKPETYARMIDELLERVARHVGSLQIMSGDTHCFANAVREYKADFGEDSRPELERSRKGPIKVRKVWVDEFGREVPGEDRRLYATACASCGLKPECGVARHGCEFLCLGCLDAERHADEGEQ